LAAGFISGFLAYLSQPILPSLLLHFLGDLLVFGLRSSVVHFGGPLSPTTRGALVLAALAALAAAAISAMASSFSRALVSASGRPWGTRPGRMKHRTTQAPPASPSALFRCPASAAPRIIWVQAHPAGPLCQAVMNPKQPSTATSPFDLYWKAYLWAWSNIKDPKFTPEDRKTFGLGNGWPWVALLVGLGAGLGVAYLVLLPYQFRVSRILLFPLIGCVVFAVSPAIQAGVIWLACLIKPGNPPDTA
jgi:hypothetical protein